MSDILITCPSCSAQFPLSEALTEQARQTFRDEAARALEQRERLSEKRLKDAKAMEQAAAKREAELETEVERRAQQLAKQAEKKVLEQVEKKYTSELAELRALKEEHESASADWRRREKDLLRSQVKLQQALDEQELEVQRMLSKERESIRKQAEAQFLEKQRIRDEEQRLKELQQEQRIKDLTKALKDAERKAEQASMERQGEVLELDIEAKLRTAFPLDQITPIAKGVRGADVVQTIFNARGEECGTILWETKNAKNWTAAWIDKLKADARSKKASIAVIASTIVPEAIERFGKLDGVWVTEIGCAIALAAALRGGLVSLDEQRRALSGQGGKQEELYRYLSSNEFKQHIEAILETYYAMYSQLASERRAMQKHWAEREKQIKRLELHTAGFAGDIHAIVGREHVEIPALGFESDDDDAEPPAMTSGRKPVSSLGSGRSSSKK